LQLKNLQQSQANNVNNVNSTQQSTQPLSVVSNKLPENLDKKKERYIEDQKQKLKNFSQKKVDIDSFAQSLFAQMTPTSNTSKSTTAKKSSDSNHFETSTRKAIELHTQENHIETQNNFDYPLKQQKNPRASSRKSKYRRIDVQMLRFFEPFKAH